MQDLPKSMLALLLFFSFFLFISCSSPCYTELSDISILPTDTNFTTASFVENPLYALTPAFVAMPKTVEDVQRCLRCAKRENIGVAIKAGGHSFASYSSIGAPGFMISMDNRKEVTWNNEVEVV